MKRPLQAQVRREDLSSLTFELSCEALGSRQRGRRQLLSTPRRAADASAASHTAAFASISVSGDRATGSARKQQAHKSTVAAAAAGHSAVPLGATLLPLVTVQGGHRRQYIWDGYRLKAVDMEEVQPEAAPGASSAKSADSRQQQRQRAWSGAMRPVQARLGRWAHDLQNAFFPNPNEVTPDYWQYARWRAVHRLFSSMSSIFATQSLLQAVGVGARRSLPAAASINWVLKDGLGRLGRLTVAARFGESFDSDLKRFRFTTSLLYAASLALEYLTPLFPRHFLPMAALANVGKSVGLTTFISTQPAFHRSFARRENLADISAKAQAQQMAVDTLGLALAVALTAACGHSEAARRALPLVAFPFLVTGDLSSIYRELRSIHLRTLNKERAEIIAAAWVGQGRVPSPREVSEQERLILPPNADLSCLPLIICSLEGAVRSVADVQRLPERQGGGTQQRYAVGLTLPCSSDGRRSVNSPAAGLESGRSQQRSAEGAGKQQGQRGKRVAAAAAVERRWAPPCLPQLPFFPAAAGRPGSVRVALRCDASAEDVVLAVLQAAYLRQALTVAAGGDGTGGDGARSSSQREAALPAAEQGGRRRPGSCTTCRAGMDADGVIKESGAAARRALRPLLRELRAAGWQVEPFCLSSSEKRFYAPLG